MHAVYQIKGALPIVFAAMGGVLVVLFGDCTVLLRALFILMAADYVSGVLVAAVFKRSGKSKTGALSSEAGYLGLIRKGGMLLLLLVANQLDAALDTSYIRASACLFLLQNEGVSILENLGLMGVPYPAFLKKTLDALQSKADINGE